MIRFGTDGIRGRAGFVPCTAEVAVAVGRAAVALAGGGRVLIARDPRESGLMLEAAVCAGVAAAGGTAVVAGVLPTSGLGACLAGGLADAGVMLTASHNPARDNGFKILGRGGAKLDDATNAQFEARLAAAPAEGEPGKIVAAQGDAWRTYEAAWSAAAPGSLALAGRHIAVDLANGAAVAHRHTLPRRYPDTRWTFLGQGDGRVNDGCGSEHTDGLAAAVRSGGCDAGIAVDGDADRCVLVDEGGAQVPGDALTWLLATGMAAPAIAVTVMSNAGLEASLPGVSVRRTPVGDRHLMAAMAAEGLPLGAEESGHVLFSDGLPGGDGLLTGLRALAYVIGPMSATLAGYRAFPGYRGKVAISRRPPLGEVAALSEAIHRGQAELGPGGRVFLRYSGTEPVLRVLVEGSDADAVQAVAHRVIAIAEAQLG